jgi:hypothetical protein
MAGEDVSNRHSLGTELRCLIDAVFGEVLLQICGTATSRHGDHHPAASRV